MKIVNWLQKKIAIISDNKTSDYIIEIISATRLSKSLFWNQSALGLSLKEHLAKDKRLIPQIAYKNSRGLSEVFNDRIANAKDNSILVFIHDDVWINEQRFGDTVIEGVNNFDIIGVAGNRRRRPNQPAWTFVNLKFSPDYQMFLSGRIWHGDIPPGEINEMGTAPAECELLDGVFLASKKDTLVSNNVRFDPQFDFHFYDMDFCRSARKAGLRLGTWLISLTHQSGGDFGSDLWTKRYQLYLQKWDMNPDYIESPQHKIDLITQKAIVEHCMLQGEVYFEAGDWIEAENAYREVVEIEARHAAAQFNLGFSLKEQKRYKDAIEHLQTAILLRKKDSIESGEDLADAYHFLGECFFHTGNLDEAQITFEKAVALNPGNPLSHSSLGYIYTDQGLLDRSIVSYRRALELEPSLVEIYSNLLLNLQSHSKLTQLEVFDASRKFSREYEILFQNNLKQNFIKQPTKQPLKIGYVSGDFRTHSVAFFLIPILSNHDETKFETYCYYNQSVKDDYTDKISFLTDHFIECSSMSDDELATRISEDCIDILVDLSGHTADNRLLVFVRKPAPIQVSYLGYVNTTGLSSIDYRITTLDTDPLDNNLYYSEKLYRLDNKLWCTYRAAYDIPDTTQAPAINNGYITFVSTNNIIKISHEIMNAWVTILTKLPTARLVIMATPTGFSQQNIRNYFTQAGVIGNRLTFYDRVELAEYRRIILEADISLDTYPFNGGTTSCELLTLGLPLVTIVGKPFVSRMGYALLKSIDLTKLAAKSYEEYIEIAITLAGDVEYLSNLRAVIKERISNSALTNEAGFTKSLEKAYQEMWQTYCKSIT